MLTRVIAGKITLDRFDLIHLDFLESCSQLYTLFIFLINWLLNQFRGQPLKSTFLIIFETIKIPFSEHILTKKCKESKDLSFDIKGKGLAP